MKIYFNGCSWTYGCELENPEQKRFSKIICDYFDAEETNLAISGGSNDKIIRELLTETDIAKYDLGIIQMTHPVRTEFWAERIKCWIPMNLPYNYKSWTKELTEKNIKEYMGYWKWHTEGEINELKDTWKSYFLNVINQKFIDTKEHMQITTIKNYFQVNNVPLILMTINLFSKKLDLFTFNLTDKSFYLSLCPGGHPDEQGHKIIAKKIIDHIQHENLL